MDESLAIGRFARLSGLTVKALRHYDEIGLLPPAAVDPVTRHRRYAPAQLDRARRIHRLRSLDLPLAEIRAVLAAPDGGRARLTAYRRDVQARVTRDQRILHGLTHLLEGDDMTDTARTDRELPAEQRRQLAADLFNLVWELLERPGRSADEDDRMVHAAHASRYHWGEVGGPEQRAIGEWQCARVYSVLGRAEPALHHARGAPGSPEPTTSRPGCWPPPTRGWPARTPSPATTTRPAGNVTSLTPRWQKSRTPRSARWWRPTWRVSPCGEPRAGQE